METIQEPPSVGDEIRFRDVDNEIESWGRENPWCLLGEDPDGHRWQANGKFVVFEVNEVLEIDDDGNVVAEYTGDGA